MNSQKNIERTVGLFVAIGIALTCALILYFGKVGDHFRGGYSVAVDFSNAGGLVRGAQVLYAGVLVGKVESIALSKAGTGVTIGINMFEGAAIRNDAHFTIKQSGFLGDQNIVVTSVSDSAPLLTNGSKVKGIDPFDFSEAASQASEAIRKLNSAIERVSGEVLDGKSIDNMKKSVQSFADLTVKLQSNSDKLNSILSNAQKGQGTVGKLLTDDALFVELKTLIHNWRVHGLLYQEKSEQRYPAPSKSGASK